MDDGLLSLKWNNHKTTFFEILRLLRDKANYTDATLAVEGKFYPVHKLVLSTCSEYFNEIFEKTPCKSPVIVLKDVRSQDLESLLDYMYLGEVNVNQNDLAILLRTAECLRIKGLAVPDDEPNRLPTSNTKHSCNSDDSNRNTPPAKRRKEDSPNLPSLSPHKTASTTTTPLPASTKKDEGSENDLSSRHSPLSSPIETPLVKIEMKDTDDVEDDSFQRSNLENSTENKEYTPKSEPDSYSISNFSGPQHQAGEISWDEGDSSYPSEGFTGDPSSQQTGGDDDDDEEVDVTSIGGEGSLTLNPLSLSLTQSKEARRCQLCQVTLANANLLRRHVEDHHFHIRKYDCIHCGKKFKRKEHRERHERIHTGEKPFACHICTSRFTQKEHLKGHIENVHNKHLKDRDKDYLNPSEFRDVDFERDESSPPSLASPSSIAASLMSSSLAAMFPATATLSHMSHLPTLTSPPGTILQSHQLKDSNSLTAFYAPVNRKTVNSPNKHVQTIEINFN